MSLSDALKLALDKELDLVEIAPNADPPVARIINYKKFQYLEEKKQKEARKHTKETELKEVRLSPFIGQHDLEFNLGKIKKFLLAGDLVKISIVFKGRQMAHQEFGPKLLARVLKELEEIGQQDRQERFEGRRFVTVVRPVKKQAKQEKQETGETKKETGVQKSQTVNKKPESKNETKN